MATTRTAPRLPRARTGPVKRLEHLPVTVFAVVMGPGGTAVAWWPDRGR